MKTLLSLMVAAAIAASSVPAVSVAEAATRTSSIRARESYSSRRLPSAAQREVNKLMRQDELEVIPIPILLGVDVDDVFDSWGDARSQGRTHEGTDIMAPRGAYIVAPADSVVSDIGVGANGGNFVYTINPGGERFYFAHLDRYAEDLKVGQVLDKGDLIGYVGNTGNASGGAPHLHFGIYSGGAQNPFPRLTETLSTSTRLDAIEKILEDADDGDDVARFMVSTYPTFFRLVQAQKLDLPEDIEEALKSVIIATPAQGGGVIGSRDLSLGSQGSDVTKLQSILITQDKGSAAKALAGAGATGYFGGMTQAALIEWQRAVGISPASGYYGPLTRAKMDALDLL